MVPLDMAKRRAPKKSRSKSRSKSGDVSPWLIGGVALAAGVGAFFLLRPRTAAAATPRPGTLPGSVPVGGGSTGAGASGASSGAAIRDLQTRLNGVGAGIGADGTYGPRTDGAVTTYGAAIGLTPAEIASIHANHSNAAVARVLAAHPATGPTTGPTPPPSPNTNSQASWDAALGDPNYYTTDASSASDAAPDTSIGGRPVFHPTEF